MDSVTTKDDMEGVAPAMLQCRLNIGLLEISSQVMNCAVKRQDNQKS